jgi:hypothetical protein
VRCDGRQGVLSLSCRSVGNRQSLRRAAPSGCHGDYAGSIATPRPGRPPACVAKLGRRRTPFCYHNSEEHGKLGERVSPAEPASCVRAPVEWT